LSSTAAAALIASVIPARYFASASRVIEERSITPAPPCTTTAHLCAPMPLVEAVCDNAALEVVRIMAKEQMHSVSGFAEDLQYLIAASNHFL
jgi:hypothetical protein